MPTPTLATISANSYVWGYNFAVPEAAISVLNDGGDFSDLLGVIPPELEPVVPMARIYLEDNLVSARAADNGAGIYLAASWTAPEKLVPTAMEWQSIGSWLGNDLVLSVSGGSIEPETQLVTWPYKGSDNADQMWSYANNFLYNEKSGLVAEIANSDMGDGATVQINTYTGNLNQQWSICGDGFIRSLLNGNVLDVYGAATQPGAPVDSYHPKYPLNPSSSAPVGQRNQGWSTGFAPLLGCNSLVTVITNSTPNYLTTVATPGDGTELTYPSYRQPLPSNSVAVYVTYYLSSNEVGFTIYDPNYSNSEPVVSFEGHQHDCVFEAGDVWVDNGYWGAGYLLNTQNSDWYEGSYAEQQPGTITCAIELNE